MSSQSNIEWTDATWNPIVGCSIVSPGCTNCYAMKMAARLDAMARLAAGQGGAAAHYLDTTKKVNGNAVWTGKVVRAPDSSFLAPLRWKKPRRIFVNSMGDLFHESIPDSDIDAAFAVMALCPQHTFQVLTKRAERMRAYLTPERRDAWSRAADPLGDWAPLDPQEYANRAHTIESVPTLRGNSWISVFSHWPLPNVWLGVSCERQQEADERIPLLLQTPAAVRFISAEPLLGAIDLTDLTFRGDASKNALDGSAYYPGCGSISSKTVRGGKHLDWVIVGGESGPKARPMHPNWARSLRHQCEAAGVAYFFKQWGAHVHATQCALNSEDAWSEVWIDMNTVVGRVGKKRAGRLLDGREHNAFPVTDSSVSQRGLDSPDANPKEATRT